MVTYEELFLFLSFLVAMIALVFDVVKFFIDITRKRLRRNAATVFELSIAEHAQRAFGGTYNLFLLYGNAVSYKAKKK